MVTDCGHFIMVIISIVYVSVISLCHIKTYIMYANNTSNKNEKKICIALSASCILSYCQLPKSSSSSLSFLLPCLSCLSHQLKNEELTRIFIVRLSVHAERSHMIWSGHLLYETQIIKLTFENWQSFVQNRQCRSQTLSLLLR